MVIVASESPNPLRSWTTVSLFTFSLIMTCIRPLTSRVLPLESSSLKTFSIAPEFMLACMNLEFRSILSR